MAAFNNLRPGDTVTYMGYAGRGLRGPGYKQASGRVVLVFPEHVVLNTGGRYGRPQVVDADNFVAARRKGRKA